MPCSTCPYTSTVITIIINIKPCRHEHTASPLHTLSLLILPYYHLLPVPKSISQVSGVHVPQCQPSGVYAPRQCHGHVCWCVNRDGISTGGLTSDSTTLKCDSTGTGERIRLYSAIAEIQLYSAIAEIQLYSVIAEIQI